MDEGQSLDALANLLNELADKPYDVSLHAQHIRLARSLQGLESELQSALEMMPEFLAAGEDIWLALIRDKASSVDLATSNGVGELLALYARAEADYLCMLLLCLSKYKLRIWHPQRSLYCRITYNSSLNATPYTLARRRNPRSSDLYSPPNGQGKL